MPHDSQTTPIANEALLEAVLANNLDAARTAIRSTHADPNVQSEDGYPALHLASSVDMARLLLDSGADVNGRDRRDCTPLHHAAANDAEELVRLLIDRGADVSAVSRGGSTPLETAYEACGQASPVISLLEAAAEPKTVLQGSEQALADNQQRHQAMHAAVASLGEGQAGTAPPADNAETTYAKRELTRRQESSMPNSHPHRS